MKRRRSRLSFAAFKRSTKHKRSGRASVRYAAPADATCSRYQYVWVTLHLAMNFRATFAGVQKGLDLMTIFYSLRLFDESLSGQFFGHAFCYPCVCLHVIFFIDEYELMPVQRPGTALIQRQFLIVNTGDRHDEDRNFEVSE